MNLSRQLLRSALKYQGHPLPTATFAKFNKRCMSNTPPPTIGYDLALDRAAQIMVNVTDHAMTLVLHTHCCSRFVDFLGSSSHFDIVGCSDILADVEASRTLKQYSKCDLVSFSQALPYRSNSFQFVVNLLPPKDANEMAVTDATTALDTTAATTKATATASGTTTLRPMLSPEDAVRVLADNGYALLGAEESVWDEQQMFVRLEELEKRGDSSLLSVQILPLSDGRKYYLALTKAL